VLVASQVFQQLPGKFGFSFSGSPEPCIGGRAADVMISAAAPGSVAISLDGSASVAAIVPTDSAVEAAIRVAAVFLELCLADPTIGRMKDAVARRGCAAIYAAAGLSAAQLSPEAGTLACPPPVGLLKSEGLVFAAGVGLPFGRLLAGELEALYGIGLCVGVKSARTSPQRALVFPVNGEGQARAVLSEAAYRGLIIEPGDARLKLDVCPGSPACRNASTETRRDAMHLVESLENAIAALPSLHISGCEKGCARRGVAAVTLVARNGRYDIVRGDGPTGPVAVAGVAPSALSAALAQLIGGRAR
jgi:precorrin-3B synthase